MDSPLGEGWVRECGRGSKRTIHPQIYRATPASVFAKHSELQPVETRNSFLCAYPEIAVAGLAERKSGVLGQPVVYRPDAVAVLTDRFCGV